MSTIFVRQVNTLISDITILKFLSFTPIDGQKFQLDPKGFICTKINHSHAWLFTREELFSQYKIVGTTDDGWMVAELLKNENTE
jgi:hypothetical protein